MTQKRVGMARLAAIGFVSMVLGSASAWAETFTVTQQIGAHGTATGGAFFTYTEGDPATQTVYTADAGYVIAKLEIGGGAVAAAQFAKVYTNSQTYAADSLITATFVKEDAWWVDPFVRNALNLGVTSNPYNSGSDPAGATHLFVAHSPSAISASSQRARGDLFGIPDLLDSIDPGFPPLAKTPDAGSDGFWVGSEAVRGGAVSTDLGIVLAGGINAGIHNLAFSLDGNWVAGENGSFSGVHAISNDQGVAFDSMAFGPGSQYLYSNVYAPSGSQNTLVKWAVLNGLATSGVNLVREASWTVATPRVRAMTVATLGGHDLVFFAGSSGTAFGVLDTVTSNEYALGTCPEQMTDVRVAGKADGTPRLYLMGGTSAAGKLYSYDLAADGQSLVSATPTAVVNASALRSLTQTGYGTLVQPDHERNAFFTCNVSGNDHLFVLEKTPAEFFVEGNFVVDGASLARDRTNTYTNNADVTATFAAPWGYAITGVTVDGAPDGNFTSSSYVYTGTALADYVYVEMTLAPAPLTITTTAVGGKGVITLPDPVYITGSEITVTANQGHVIAQIVAGGSVVPGVLGQSSAVITPTFSEGRLSVSASFAKASAWWVESFIRNRINTSLGYSPMGGDIDEDERYFVMARGPDNMSSTTIGFNMYDVAALADSVDPNLAVAGYNTRYLLSNQESFRSVTVSAFYQAVFSVPRSTKHFVGYPFDTATSNTIDTCYAVTNNANINIIPGKFSADGRHYYGRNLNGTNPIDGTPLSSNYISMYDVQTNAVGQPQNLVFVKYWNIGAATTEMHVHDHNGTDILYVGFGLTQGIRAINTATDVIVTNALATGTGTLYSIYPAGIADGTPRLVVNDSLQVAVYDLADDMMSFRSTTPVVKYTRLQLDPLPIPRSPALQTLIPLDDDSRAFHGREFSGTRVGVSVVERKPDTLIIERAFSAPVPRKEQVVRYTVPFGGSTTVTVAVPFRYAITGIATNGVPITVQPTRTLVLPFTNLANHIRLDVTVDGPDLSLVDPVVIFTLR